MKYCCEEQPSAEAGSEGDHDAFCLTNPHVFQHWRRLGLISLKPKSQKHLHTSRTSVSVHRSSRNGTQNSLTPPHSRLATSRPPKALQEGAENENGNRPWNKRKPSTMAFVYRANFFWERLHDRRPKKERPPGVRGQYINGRYRQAGHAAEVPLVCDRFIYYVTVPTPNQCLFLQSVPGVGLLVWAPSSCLVDFLPPVIFLISCGRTPPLA